MEAVIEQIIVGLLCTDTEKIRQATNELNKAYENPETLPAICRVIVSQRETQVRQFAAVLLNKRLQKRRIWQMVPADQKESIKACMLQALIDEHERPVKSAIAQFIGSLVRHEEENKESWLGELLQFIFTRCSCDDPKESEVGASIFATLTDTAPEQFISHMDSICQMFAAVLVSAEAKGNLTTPTIVNITTGMSYLMPFVSGHTTAEQTVIKVIPLLIKTLYAFAQKGDEQEFTTVFDVVDSISEYAPTLLNNSVKPLMEFCLETANNRQIDGAIRAQATVFIGRLARIKKKVIVKQKMLEPILAVVFEMMCSETDVDDTANELFSGESSSSPVTSATQTLDLLAINMSPEKLIPPLLQLLESALQNPDPNRRRGAFLCIAVIAEGCAEAICNKYLEVMLNIIKSGIVDSSPHVRISSFFALGQFSEYLQPEISKYADQILPVLFDFLHQLVVELKTGQPEPKHTERMFYALEIFCENLEEKIVPHLPLLMERLFETLEPQNSVELRVSALRTVSATATSAKEHFMPYFPRVVAILQNYLVKECGEEMEELRVEAIDTLAAITRVVGKENFLPLANDTMSYCLLMLEDGPDDPDFRRAIYNLVGALSIVVNESMSAVFPKIMDRIIESVISTEDILPVLSEASTQRLILDEASSENDIDLDDTDGEDDNVDDYHVENDYISEKEDAVMALKEFAANTGQAFTPYLQIAFENVYKIIDHPQDTIRKAVVETLCTFVIALNKLNDIDGVKRACGIILPKFAQILRKDEEQGVVTHLVDVLGDMFSAVLTPSMPSQEIADMIFACIKDLLNSKMACQFNEPSGGGDEDDDADSEFDEILIESVGNMLPQFGRTLSPEIFSMYFGRIYNFFLNKLAKAKKNDIVDQRTFVYGVLSETFQSLGKCVVTYFDVMCSTLIAGVADPEPKARQNCYYGLGELVLYAEEKSFESFHLILQALSGAIASETNPSALDNICGAVARLIVTNHNMVPLEQVLPVLFTHLPLREDKNENDLLLQAFRVLYMQAPSTIMQYIEQILVITIDALYKKEMPDEESTINAVALLKEIRGQYPDKFHNVANANPEVFNFVQTL